MILWAARERSLYSDHLIELNGRSQGSLQRDTHDEKGFDGNAVSILNVTFGLFVLTAFLGRGGVATWILRTPPLTFLGQISFSLYLFHMPVIGFVHGWGDGLWPKWEKPNGFLFSAIALVISIILAELSRRYVERPFISLGKRTRWAD